MDSEEFKQSKMVVLVQYEGAIPPIHYSKFKKDNGELTFRKLF